jgi:uncharacterized membrane protein
VTTDPTSPALERILARLLHYGTALATTIVGLGLLLHLAGRRFDAPAPWGASGLDLMTIGIAGFILLPITRVVVMLGAYLYQRDIRLSLISATVLAIIMVGLVAGVAW